MSSDIQIGRLRAFRASRNASRWASARDRLRQDAGEGKNVMPPLIEAVASGVTLGEIVSTLKELYGEHRPGS